MRKSSAITMAIMLIAFGAMFAAAGSALQPLAADAQAGKELTRMLEHRGDLAEGSRLRVLRLGGGGERLAPEGRGIVVWLTPGDATCRRRGGLRLLALRVGQEVLLRFAGSKIDWVEINYEWPPAKEGDPELREPIRTLLDASSGDRVAEPHPALPGRLS